MVWLLHMMHMIDLRSKTGLRMIMMIASWDGIPGIKPEFKAEYEAAASSAMSKVMLIIWLEREREEV